MKRFVVILLVLTFLFLMIGTVAAQEETKENKAKICCEDSTKACCKKAKEDAKVNCMKVKKEDKKSAFQIKEIEPFNYVAVEMTGSYEQHPMAFETLYSQAGMLGLDMSVPSFGIYFGDPSSMPEEELKWEIGLPAGQISEVKEPLIIKEWTSTLMVSTMYEGPFNDEFFAAYQKAFQWIGENSYRPAGPMMEKYFSIPGQDEKGNWAGKVEILIPVEKISAE